MRLFALLCDRQSSSEKKSRGRKRLEGKKEIGQRVRLKGDGGGL